MKFQFKYAATGAIVLCAMMAIQAPAQNGSIRGRVKEQNGRQLEEVEIRAIDAADKQRVFEARSDSKGEFTLGLPAGSYSLSFQKQGYKTFTTRKLDVAAGETVKLSRVIEMAREGESYAVIRGAVLQGVGFTLSNAAVTIERIDGGRKFRQETVSREGGEFAFRLRAEKARYRLTASARGFQPSSVEIEIEGDEVRNIAITLKEAR